MGDSATLEQSAGNIDEQVSGVVEQAKELQDAASSHISRTSVEEQALRKSALSLDSNIHRLRSLIDSLHRNKILDPKLADKLDEDLQRARCILVDGDASSFLPGNAQGGFLRMFLGPINVHATRKDVQLKVKEEYNSYRSNLSVTLVLVFDGPFSPLLACSNYGSLTYCEMLRHRTLSWRVRSEPPWWQEGKRAFSA